MLFFCENQFHLTEMNWLRLELEIGNDMEVKYFDSTFCICLSNRFNFSPRISLI